MDQFCVDSTDKLATQLRLSRFHFENVSPVDLGMLCYCEVNCLFVYFLPRKPVWKILDNNQDTENYQIRRRLRPNQFESHSDLLIQSFSKDK